MSQRPDQIIAGKYRLIRRLARGGMGSVYKARHLDLATDVALKFLRPESEVDEQSLARFKREARAAGQLKSPHVVRIFDYGVDEETPYIAMELLEGEDLSQLLERVDRLSLLDAVRLIEQAGRGLQTAHAAGLVHRDIKPANLFLAEVDGQQIVKLLDFGIAKETSAPSGETTTGMVFGSPAYMSPEQARGGTVDVRSDIWSLGALLYRMILGQPPFSGTNASDIVVKLCTEEPPSASSLLGVEAPELDQLFCSALAKDRKKRFSSVEEFLSACRLLVDESELTERISVTEELNSRPVGRAEETTNLERVTPSEEEVASQLSTETLSKTASRESEASPAQGWRNPLGLLLILIFIGVALLSWLLPRGSAIEQAPPPGSRRSVDTRQLMPDPKPEGAGAPEESVEPADLSKGSIVETARAEVPSRPAPKPVKVARPRNSPTRHAPPPAPEADNPATDPVFGLPVSAKP